MAVVTIANFCSLPSLSFGQALGKLQGKVDTHSEGVGWWRTLMVECVTLFDYLFHYRILHCIWDYILAKLHEYLKKMGWFPII